MPFGVAVNRPFLFVVRECTTGTIVMASQVILIVRMCVRVGVRVFRCSFSAFSDMAMYHSCCIVGPLLGCL